MCGHARKRGALHAKSTGLIAGPLSMDLWLPLTEESALAAGEAAEAAARRWLGWCQAAPEAGWQTNRMLHDRDSQVRNRLFVLALRASEAALGPMGGKIAAADAGRLDLVAHNSLGLGREDS